MNIEVDPRIEKDIRRFPKPDRARISRVVNLFSEKGFSVSEKYLKKLTRDIWELRPGRIRLLFGVVYDKAVIVNVFMKKTQKTPINEIQVARKRMIQWQS